MYRPSFFFFFPRRVSRPCRHSLPSHPTPNILRLDANTLRLQREIPLTSCTFRLFPLSLPSFFYLLDLHFSSVTFFLVFPSEIVFPPADPCLRECALPREAWTSRTFFDQLSFGVILICIHLTSISPPVFRPLLSGLDSSCVNCWRTSPFRFSVFRFSPFLSFTAILSRLSAHLLPH